MAADEQTNTKAKLKPIAIRSKRIVNEVSNVVISTISGVSNENVYWSNEEKERCKDRFNQVFTSSALQYVHINGESAANVEDAEDDTSEIEQVNRERADYYREELPMKVDAQLKEVVQRRKQVPYACARHIATQCKHHQSYLVKLKYAELSRLPQRNRIHNEKEETVVVQTCSSSAKKLAEEYTSLTKAVENVKNLRDSLHMLDRIGGTRTDRVLYDLNSRPRNLKTDTPLRERLIRLQSTPTPIRASKRLGEKDTLKTRQLISSKGYTLRNLPAR